MEKIIASDLDGTLLNSKSEISQINLDQIGLLKERGICVVPVTGRTLFEVPKALREYKDLEYIIYANGSGIYSKKDGNLFYDPIPNEVKNNIFSMLSEYDTFIELYSNGHVYVDKNKFSDEKFYYYGIDEYFIPELHISREPIDNLSEYAYNDDNFVEMFNVYFHNQDERATCWQRLLDLKYPTEMTSSMTTNIEITHANVSKGTALKRLCDILNFDIKNVIAVGDSGNDLTMLAWLKIVTPFQMLAMRLKKRLAE